jgi:hypothetical protein
LSKPSNCLLACWNDCVVMCVFRCTLMFACHFYSTAYLDLSNNSLTGTIPSQIALMSNLCESSVVWLLVVMIVLACVFSLYSNACLSYFILQLGCLSMAIV